MKKFSSRDLRPCHAEVMRGLRENGWSLKGIARIYGITPFGVKLMIHEKDLPLDPVVFGPECVDGHD